MTANNQCCPQCQLQQYSYLPVRSSWARAALVKAENDKHLETIDRRTWYILARRELLHEEYRNVFHEFHEDEETTDFIQQSQDKSDNFPLQLMHSLTSSVLTFFMARTSGSNNFLQLKSVFFYSKEIIFLANGLIGRGRMFVFSTAQFKTLLDLNENPSQSLSSLLDIGAGDGSITARMAGIFKQVYATEMSSIMQWRLSNYGYTVLDVDQWGDLKFDVITCLNVLDRCEKPLSLLKNIREHLNPIGGCVIISLVLPFKPYFEYNNDHNPNESIRLNGQFAEEQINELIIQVFRPLGFRLKKLARLPYLCEGDMDRSYYFLSDYIFVLELD